MDPNGRNPGGSYFTNDLFSSYTEFQHDEGTISIKNWIVSNLSVQWTRCWSVACQKISNQSRINVLIGSWQGKEETATQEFANQEKYFEST